MYQRRKSNVFTDRFMVSGLGGAARFGSLITEPTDNPITGMRTLTQRYAIRRNYLALFFIFFFRNVYYYIML